MTASQKYVGRGTFITASCSTTFKTSYEIRLDDISPMILGKVSLSASLKWEINSAMAFCDNGKVSSFPVYRPTRGFLTMLGYLFAVGSRVGLLFLAVPAFRYEVSISRFHLVAPLSCLLIGPDRRRECLACFIAECGLLEHTTRRIIMVVCPRF